MKQVRLGLFVIMSLFLLSSCAGPQYRWFNFTDCISQNQIGYEERDRREIGIKVNMDSEPKDAKVYVKGKHVGNTPMTVELHYAAYDLYENEILCEYKLEWTPGGEWAHTYGPILDRKSTFKRTEFEHRWYDIDIYKENYKKERVSLRTDQIRNDYSHVCFLQKDATPYHSPTQQQQQQQQVIIEKGKASSYLSVTSDPSDAEVYLDGNLIGLTPINNIKLNPGNYRLKVMKGGKSWERQILLPEEGSLQIKAKPE